MKNRGLTSQTPNFPLHYTMSFREAIFIALSSLRANRLRSLLTLLGIVIGVMTVIAVVSFISGLNEDLAATAVPTESETEPGLPSNIAPVEPSVELGTQARPSKSVDVERAIEKATKELRARVDSLETELQKSQKEISTAQKEKSEISGKLQETNAELEHAKEAAAMLQAAQRALRTCLRDRAVSAGTHQRHSGR
jgi:peptidoglycan hydrolase CwlO-like protein